MARFFVLLTEHQDPRVHSVHRYIVNSPLLSHNALDWSGALSFRPHPTRRALAELVGFAVGGISASWGCLQDAKHIGG